MRCTAALLSRTYVFTAFDGRWPGVTFLILALSGTLALGPVALRNCGNFGYFWRGPASPSPKRSPGEVRYRSSATSRRQCQHPR
jgi:hypothetical protein